MEKLLLRLAEQLDGLDEASLMSLWTKYAKTACNFEPTKRWEQATLVLCLIQAKHMKNQLFNHYWKEAQQPDAAEGAGQVPEKPAAREPTRPHECRILTFPGEPPREKA